MSLQYQITRPPLPTGVQLEENVYITMRDGIKLAVDVYKPEKEGRYPVILAIAPYKKEGMAGSPSKGYHSSEGGDPGFYVPRGYIMVFAQCRGSGMSQGQYTFYSIQEQQDGHDLVEGIAQQPWCDGNVGMLGGSYLGKSQFYTAGQRPPHLKCIVPYDAGEDLYRDWAYQGGGMYYGAGFATGWSFITITSYLYPGPVEGKVPPVNVPRELLENYLDGPYWWERSPIYHVDKIVCPVLNIAGGSSWLHSRGQLACYQKIKAPQKLIVGPNSNKLLSALARIVWENQLLNEYIARWFDHWLKGIDTGIMDEPSVLIYDDGKDEWRYENEYPLARTQWIKFYLHSNPAKPEVPPQGIISTDEPAVDEKPDKYKAPRERSQLAVNKPPLAYVTDPLDKDLKLAGPLSVTIYASSESDDTRALGWFVRVGDVAPDGTVTLITKGSLKASFREIDKANSAPGQPYHPCQKQVYVEPNKIYDYEIEVSPIFHTFKKGHKLWLQIASDDPAWTVPNPEDAICGPIPDAKNSVYHDRTHPSHLLLPVIPDTPMIDTIKKPIWDVELTKFCGYPVNTPFVR
ncbi:CocE/NonD family hydrolase [Chloroflexota bacterium]